MATFVGRTAELESLSSVLKSAFDGPVMAVVVGEPGSGKSRLLAEAMTRAEVEHSFSVMGYESERRVPMAAAGGLLRALGNVPGDGKALEALLLGPEVGPLDSVRVFEAAHRAFRKLEHALLVVDDLQWVDELSLSLCHYLIRAAADSGQTIAVFAATREETRSAQLNDALAPDRVTTITLPPLSRSEGLELATKIAPQLDESVALDLWERSRGSPFWLESLLRDREARAAPGQVLSARLRGTGSDEATLLGLVAVAGRPIAVGDTTETLGWSLSRGEAAAQNLVDRGVVFESKGVVRVAHDLIREEALAELPDDARKRYARTLAQLLEKRAGDDLVLLREALEHRRAAGLPALGLATRIATSRNRRLLGPEGVKLLTAVADEWEILDDASLALHEAVAALADEMGLREEALAGWSFVAEQAPTSLRRAFALLSASKAAYGLGRTRPARDLLTRSREATSNDKVLALEQNLQDATISLWLEKDTSGGRELAHKAVAAASALVKAHEKDVEIDARLRRAYLEALRLDYETTVQEDDQPRMLRKAEARVAAVRGLEREEYLAASLSLGAALRQNGNLEEAVTRFRTVWEEAHGRVLPQMTVDAGYWLGTTLTHLAELEEAEKILVATRDLASRAGDVPRARNTIGRALYRILLERGEARDALKGLQRYAAEERSRHQQITLYGDLAIWTARLEGEAGEEAIDEAIAAGRAYSAEVQCPRCGAEFLLLAAEAWARSGSASRAQEVLDEWDRKAGTKDPKDLLHRLQTGALVETDPAGRAAALEKALAATNESPYRLTSIWTHFDLGRALADAGDPRSVQELQELAETAQVCGAVTLHELATQSLRSLGVRTWRRGRVGGPLTEREEEIARLVAGGATNREIAEKLFLATKTVERHVSNVLRKLGVRNRTELTALLRDRSIQDAGNSR